jgi:hypothetical protein
VDGSTSYASTLDALQLPDGRVLGQDGGTYADAQTWLAALHAAHVRRRAAPARMLALV